MRPTDLETRAIALDLLRRRHVHYAKAFALYSLGLLFLGILARMLGWPEH